ncbi:MAG TPA: phosphoglucosamine mutase, partial [Thermopetrobacter sp.]|nr:phosphoglucosamine mutase [Thermopetrobacter sp.]
CHLFEPVPQVLRNVRYSPGRDPLDDAAVRGAVEKVGARLGDAGRLVIRHSGTEPLIRVMAEGDDAELVHEVVDEIVGLLQQQAA